MNQTELPNPISAITEKRVMIDSLIANSLAVPIFLVKENGVRVSEVRQPGESYTDYKKTSETERKLLGAIIQISDTEVIVTNYNDLQMQILSHGKMQGVYERPFLEMMTTGEALVYPSQLLSENSTPIGLFGTAVHWYDSTVVADAATNPKGVIDKLTEGVIWLKRKQQTDLQNRTETTSQFNAIIKSVLPPHQIV